MLNTEKIFDILPLISDLYDKLNIDEYRKNIDKNEDLQTAGLKLFKYIFKNSKLIKEEIFEIVAIIEDKTTEEVKKQGIGSTLKTLKEIYEDEEINSFFK